MSKNKSRSSRTERMIIRDTGEKRAITADHVKVPRPRPGGGAAGGGDAGDRGVGEGGGNTGGVKPTASSADEAIHHLRAPKRTDEAADPDARAWLSEVDDWLE